MARTKEEMELCGLRTTHLIFLSTVPRVCALTGARMYLFSSLDFIKTSNLRKLSSQFVKSFWKFLNWLITCEWLRFHDFHSFENTVCIERFSLNFWKWDNSLKTEIASKNTRNHSSYFFTTSDIANFQHHICIKPFQIFSTPATTRFSELRAVVTCNKA